MAGEEQARAFHFIPTSSSWLNLIERFFAELGQRQLKRLAVTSVDELIAAITAYIERRKHGAEALHLDRLRETHP